MAVSLTVLLAILLISLFCMGLVGLSQNIRLIIRAYFMLAIAFLNGWMILLFVSNLRSPIVLLLNRAVYVSPIIGLFFLWQFFGVFYKKHGRQNHGTWLDVGGAAIAVVGAVVASTRLNVEAVRARVTDGHISGYSIVPGPLSSLVAAILFVLAAMVALRLTRAYLSADRHTKKSLQVILVTLSLALAISMAANVVAPLLIGGSDAANVVSSIAGLLFIISVAYSILRYSFLDVRLLVIRSVGYVAGLALVLVLVDFVQIALFRILGIGDPALALKQQLTLLFLFSLAALSFNPLRATFAKLTRALFFKDGYDQAKFIAAFNAGLVKRTSLSDILTQSLQDIEQALRPGYCTIGVGTDENTAQYHVSSRSFSRKERELFMDIAMHSTQQILVKELAGRADRNANTLTHIANDHGAEVLVKLVGSMGNEESAIGYIALGPKASGEVYNKTDVEVLGAIANALAIAVQNALRFEEIQRFTVTLQEKVDEATRQLRHTNKKLVEMDETKDDFISLASHQLRTPLTSIKGYLSLVLEGDVGKLNSQQAKMLRQAFSSSQHMVYLISDLLNITRLRTGKFVMEPAPIDLSQIVQEEVAGLVEAAQAKGIELAYRKPVTFPKLMLDETKTRQVIMNFIDNAIHYTHSGGHIRVELEERPTSVELRVIDDGMGVPKAEQHHLFTKFYRATNARTARPDGTGLGLFMARKVVIAQSGSIIFSSREGHGSTFGFVFSKSRLKVPDPAPQAVGRTSVEHEAASHGS